MTKLPKPECVVKVGDGRGFIIQHRYRLGEPQKEHIRKVAQVGGFEPAEFRAPVRRFIVTAAHCLPKLPPAHAFSYTKERTYAKLLGTISGKKNTVWAECRFVDPVADIAVLDSPDEQELSEQADAYDALVNDAPAIPISSKLTEKGWVLTLACKWKQIPLLLINSLWGTTLAIGFGLPGMSGSPILNDQGRAVGVVAQGQPTVPGANISYQEREPLGQPILARNLPGWLVK